MYNKLLIDFDWVIYRAGFSDLSFEDKILSVDNTLQRILDDCQIYDYDIYLTGSTNFRYKVDPEYKSGRKNNPKPEHYKELKEYLLNKGAILDDEYEADDLCGLNTTETTIIVGEDKDLLTIPSRHYRIKRDWSKNEFVDISDDKANLMFMIQLLTGDKIDSIQGVKNPAKAHHENPPNFTYNTAANILENLSPTERLKTVEDMYKIQFQDDWVEMFEKNANLLWIQRKNAKTYKECNLLYPQNV